MASQPLPKGSKVPTDRECRVSIRGNVDSVCWVEAFFIWVLGPSGLVKLADD